MTQHLLQVHNVAQETDDVIICIQSPEKKSQNQNVLPEISLLNDSHDIHSLNVSSKQDRSSLDDISILDNQFDPENTGSAKKLRLSSDNSTDKSNLENSGSMANSSTGRKRPGPSSRTKSSLEENSKPVETSSYYAKTRYECDSCWFTSESQEELVEHSTDKHYSEEDSKTRKKMETAEVLMKKRQQIKTTLKFRMTCLLCNNFVSCQSDMMTHLGKEGHAKSPLCPRCPYLATSMNDLLEHGRGHFEGFAFANFQCVICSFRSQEMQVIEAHCKDVHGGN